jgi:hypothetical protein
MALPNNGASEGLGRATRIPAVSSGIYLPKLKRTIKHEDFPYVDTRIVRMVISGEYDVRFRLGDRALPLDSTETEEAYPVGTRTCPEDCTSINVWGLQENATATELLSVCQGFGAIADIKLSIPEADRDEAWATIRFVERLSAQLAQTSLHRTMLHGKVRHTQGLVCCTASMTIWTFWGRCWDMCAVLISLGLTVIVLLL